MSFPLVKESRLTQYILIAVLSACMSLSILDIADLHVITIQVLRAPLLTQKVGYFRMICSQADWVKSSTSSSTNNLRYPLQVSNTKLLYWGYSSSVRGFSLLFVMINTPKINSTLFSQIRQHFFLLRLQFLRFVILVLTISH